MFPHTVMIVEDNADHLRWLSAVLKTQFNVLTAQTGKAAQLLFRDHQHDIDTMVLDVRLPDMTAFELLNSLEKMCIAGIPAAIIQTEYDDQKWMRELFGEYRTLSYLVKPFEAGEIIDAVNAAINADPYLYKGIQIGERLAVMSALNSIRLMMYHHATQMSEDRKNYWMPYILDLYRIDGSEPGAEFPSGLRSDFKLTAPLRSIFDLLTRFYGVSLPPGDLLTVGIHPDLWDALGETMRVLNKDDVLRFDWKKMSNPHTDDLCKFWIGELSDASLGHWQSMSDLFLPRASMPSMNGVAIIAEHDSHLLQAAILAGIPHVFVRDQKFETVFVEFFARLAQRQYELSTIQKFSLNHDLNPVDAVVEL